jgi:hypothetical protein
LYKELVIYYAVDQLLKFIADKKIISFNSLLKALPGKKKRSNWINAGGQLMEETELDKLKERITTGKIKSWDAVHAFYSNQSALYSERKLQHALASLVEITGTKELTKQNLKLYLLQFLQTKEWMVKGIFDSRAKDYSNPFRKMIYETQAEMDEVIGKLKDNTFIQQQEKELKTTKAKIQKIIKEFKL